LADIDHLLFGGANAGAAVAGLRLAGMQNVTKNQAKQRIILRLTSDGQNVWTEFYSQRNA
jgi:hypothetical protein